MANESRFFSDTFGVWLRKAITWAQLLEAWAKVKGNRGMAGVDGVTVEQFGRNTQERLDILRQQVIGGRYKAQPYLRIWLPRPGKSPRPLAVPCVIDRVLQTAWAQVLMPLFEAEFEDCSFAYRQGRGVRQAVARIESLQRQGYRWVVDADIESFFDQIPHAPLLKAVEELVPNDPSVLAVLHHWLKTPVQDGGNQAVPEKGVAQGLPVSPMLANLYLDHLDEALLQEDLALVRYAADFVILTKSREHADAALELTEQTLSQLQLRLNDHKTRIVHLDQGMEFLGWHFVRSMALLRSNKADTTPATEAVWADPEAITATPAALPVEIELPPTVTLAVQSEPHDPAAPRPPLQEQPTTPLPEALDSQEPEPASEQAPVDALQRTLYVVEAGCELGKESERLMLRKSDAVLLDKTVCYISPCALNVVNPSSGMGDRPQAGRRCIGWFSVSPPPTARLPHAPVAKTWPCRPFLGCL